MGKIVLFLTIFMSIGMYGFSQTKTATGTVKDDSGNPIPFATVMEKGTKNAVSADAQGNFSIKAKTGADLEISATGFETQVFKATEPLNAVLKAGKGQTIEEVVVTALGIRRQKRDLGYATQEVKGSDLTQTTQPNVINSLQGRVAGVQITAASGAVGASSRLVLRGNNSFNDNQPLIVVDGVPISNSATNIGGYGSVDYGSGLQEIDPDNIESVNILKGANAAALYGYRAGNGVILITTKTGKGAKGIGVTYSGGISFEKPYIMPRYQNLYGQGSTGDEYNWKKSDPNMSYQDYAIQNGFAYVNGRGDGVNDSYDESWGPRLDAGLNLPQYNSPLDANGNRIPTPWISHSSNVKDFFQTGYTMDHNVALTSNTEKGSTRMGLGYQQQQGSIPNTDQTKYSLNLNTVQNLTKKFTVEGNVNYLHIKNNNLVGQGYNAYNPMESIGSWFGRQVDLKDLKAHYADTLAGSISKDYPNGFPYNWNSNYHNNPFAEVYDIYQNSRTKDRMFGYVSMAYAFDKWFNLKLRAGDDWSTEFRKETTSNRDYGNVLAGQGGQFTQWEYHLNELNLDAIATGGGKIGTSDVTINYTAGANYRDYTQKNSSIGAGNLAIPNFYTISNAKGNTTQTMYDYHLRSNSIFGQASFGFRNWLSVDVTARNDWSSSLPANNRSYFYPSVSASWIFSDALNLKSDVFSYGKLRASWAKVGNGTGPYQVFPVYTPVTYSFNGVNMYRYPAALPAGINLKPEMAKSNEVGLELQFFKNRLGLDATYYDKITSNQIMQVNISNAGGSSSKVVNSGEIENKGVELQLHLGILRPASDAGLNWDMDINFAKNSNKVNKLYVDPTTGQPLQSFNLAGAWGITVDAIPGKPFGVIRGGKADRDSLGNVIVGANGLPTFKGVQEIGNVSPDFTGGINNTFRYKNFNLSFLIDFRKGGDIFSFTDMWGAYTGVLDYTAANNVRETGVILGKNAYQDTKFVKADGTPNDIAVDPETAFGRMSYSTTGGTEFNIIDASFIKLRQIQLGYTLPHRLLANSNVVKGVTISLFSYNVALLATSKSNRAHIDPETGFGVGNSGLGLEQYQIPSNRSVGLKLNVSF
ncbi:SusC/RagA family TonB-linked outer membrane protein [Niabella soli]|uniref:TonB-denpendent receptor n=1 Tax=Niabella soli DSM 19437 TaxID=929713 RepID=W0F2C4_9BACT|nr:SusC/RagA family TonB-linked outer membrane protein [Niabella soli]AHF15486.1 TonB-denpendent receptor [Niabella soli DSM 19437]